MHGRSARAKYGKEVNFPKGWDHWPSETKHIYIKIIDKNYVLKINTKEYPKRVCDVISSMSVDQTECGGAGPTHTLQSRP